jgi:preprotein translocase SecE subunit
MATDAVAVSRWRSITTFIQESYHEIRYKTTWPDFAQVRQASVAILVFVLLVGLVITLLDTVLHGLMVRLIPSLFR